MTIKELEEFRMICQRGSLARASKELFMSPQGLSRVLKNLENELECTLLDRVASGIELTESGQRLYDYANTVLSEYDKLKKEIDMIRASEEGTVELLVAYDILRYLTARLYSGISEEISECDIFLYGISGSDRRENAA